MRKDRRFEKRERETERMHGMVCVETRDHHSETKARRSHSHFKTLKETMIENHNEREEQLSFLIAPAQLSRLSLCLCRWVCQALRETNNPSSGDCFLFMGFGLWASVFRNPFEVELLFFETPCFGIWASPVKFEKPEEIINKLFNLLI